MPKQPGEIEVYNIVVLFIKVNNSNKTGVLHSQRWERQLSTGTIKNRKS
jgi:hypothetical protein